MIEALDGYAVVQRLREDDQFVLLRASRVADGAPVLLLGARDGRRDSRERIEREFVLRLELDPSFAAMPLALADSHSGHVLVLADPGATPLSHAAPGPLAPLPFLHLAIHITRALARLHRRGLVHKDLRPEHILVLPGAAGVRLTGFGSAARLGEVPRGPDGYQSGSLPYMAPEQTGRVNRPVDTRSDLYALGVVLYQLLGGALPFTASDPVQWIHCHVARAPEPLADAIDPCCADIVRKLLAKAPEQRYQSAGGLLADLMHCLALQEAQLPAVPFPLGRSDGTERHDSGALVGRGPQLAQLEEILRAAGAGQAPDPVLLAGPGGSGKTRLMAALRAHAAGAGWQVLHVKFEQHLIDVPYGALRLGMPAEPGWRALAADDAALLAHVLPGLGRPQRVLADEAQALIRLQAGFRRLVAALANSSAPLLLCLDDLQWADPASLALLTELVAPPSVPHLMLLGAVRGAVSAPALAAARQRLERQGTVVTRVVLLPLQQAENAQLVAQALGCPVAACAPLAEQVFARCRGNPMFTVQLLTRLAELGLLRQGAGGAGWDWDSAAVAAYAGAASLVALLAERLNQLPYSALESVKLLACLGQQTELALLARVAGMSEAEVDESLWPAARLGLVMRSPRAYTFVHDRVREVAAALLGARSAPQRHLHIGRVLGHGARGDAVFAAASHLNRARAAMSDSELRTLVRINAAAGKRAREQLAFDSACACYRQAVALTPAQAWQQAFERTLALHLALADCACAAGQSDSVYALLAQVSARAAEAQAAPVVRAAIVQRQMAVCQALGRHREALALALTALGWFGLDFPDTDDGIDDALAQERAAIAALTAQAGSGQALAPAAAADEAAAMVTALCAELGPSVCIERPLLYRLLAARSLHFVLRHGRSEASCAIYSRYAVTLAASGEVDQAFSFARLARDAGASPLRRARIEFAHAAFLQCWREPLGSAAEQLAAAAQACQQAGDLAHAGYAAQVGLWYSMEAGISLAELAERARHSARFARRQGNTALLQLFQDSALWCDALRGEGGADAARAVLARMHAAGDSIVRACSLLLRQEAAYVFGLYDESQAAAETLAQERSFVLNTVFEAGHRMFHALALSARHAEASASGRAAIVQQVRAIEAALRTQALACPTNYSGRYLLVAAQLAVLEGRDLDAMRDFDAALALARQARLVHLEALTADLAAHFHAQRGSETCAAAYAAHAWDAWSRWGALARMRSLEQRFPALRRHAAPAPAAHEIGIARDVCQAMALASDAQGMAELLLRFAVLHVGATRAVLLVPGITGLRCMARAMPAQDTVMVEACDVALGAAALPQAVVLGVMRERATLVVNDALQHPLLAGCEAWAGAAPRSVLCAPLSSQGMTVGVLYLEHGLLAGHFSPSRTALLELVAAQAALVLDRERLVAALDLEWLHRKVVQQAHDHDAADGEDMGVAMAAGANRPTKNMMQINS